MLSVPSDTAASVTFQAPQPKPVRPDPSQQNDSFGALVDSSVPAASAAQQQSAPPRRADDTAANTDNARSRDASAADQAPKNASNDRNASTQQASDANAATDAAANADATAAERSKAKPGAAKAGAAKTNDKQSSDTIPAADSAGSAQPGATPVMTTPNPVAVVIPVAIAPTQVPAATPATANAPLAIAAAAIATSAAAGQTPATPAAAASAADTASAVVAATAPAKTADQGATVAVNAKPATQTDATATAESTLTAATAPVALKPTLLKAPVAAQAKTTLSDAQGANSGASDPSATVSPASALQANAAPAADGAKPQAGSDMTDAAKAEAVANASVAAATDPSAHDHSQLTTTTHAPADAPDAGTQVTGMIQQQLPAAAATVAPAGPLSVAVASNAPVPMSGLALEIAASARSGKSHFEIRLDPANLGRIDVRIDVDRNGQVTSHLTVEKPETLSMLRQDAPQLQRALDDAGFKTGDGGLQFSLRDQSSSGQNNGNDTGRNAQRLVISEDDTIPATVAGRTYGRMLGSSSGVDIRV